MEYLCAAVYTLAVLLSTFQTALSFCSSFEVILPGAKSVISNSPYNMTLGYNNCNWQLTSRPGYLVKLNCHHVKMRMRGDACLDYVEVRTSYDWTIGEVRHCTPFTAEGTIITMNSWFSEASIECEVKAEKESTAPSIPEEICNCGWPYQVEPRILNGENAEVNEFPSMAFIQRNHHLVCGATIISERAVVSAAHCFDNSRNPRDFQLVVGDHFRKTELETDATRIYRLLRLIIHKDYNKYTLLNDIALMVTSDIIIFWAKVGPACLPFHLPKEDVMKKSVTVAGWGRTSVSQKKASRILKKAVLQVTPDSSCEETYGPFVYESSLQICTHSPPKSPYRGDSGGPLYHINEENKQVTLVGIVSYGRNTTKLPTVFVNVHHYLPWIQHILPDERFCVIRNF